MLLNKRKKNKKNLYTLIKTVYMYITFVISFFSCPHKNKLFLNSIRKRLRDSLSLNE